MVFEIGTDWITALANAKQKSKALCYGGYRNLLTMPKQLIFERECDTERVIVAVNSDSRKSSSEVNSPQFPKIRNAY
jgi:cyclomaltodextrinase